MKTLLTLAIVLASTSAFATRARVTALQDAAHITDTATIYSKPAHIFAVGDSVTLESGNTNKTTASDDAEALLVRSMGDAKWALSLGHDDAKIYEQRTNAGSPVLQQNPLEVTYGMKAGDMSWAATLGYSSFNDKTAEVKDNTMGLKFGAATSTWDATIDLGLVNKTTSGTAAAEEEFKGKSNVSVKGGYWVASDLYVHGNIDMGGYEVSTGGVVGSEIKTTEYSVGAINTIKSEGNEFFYGASLASTESKESKAPETKITSLKLPLIMGIEANANSWLTLRGSVTQTVLINNDKTSNSTTTTVEKSPGDNNTKFAAGAGLKLGKLSVDGSILSGAAGQTLDTSNLLTTVGMTYSF